MKAGQIGYSPSPPDGEGCQPPKAGSPAAACHHGQQSNAWRQGKQQAAALAAWNRLGKPAWSEWYTLPGSLMTGNAQRPQSQSPVGQWTTIELLIHEAQSAWPAAGERQLIALAGLARDAAALCDSRAAQFNSRGTWDRADLAKVLLDFSPGDFPSWDSAAQLYLALTALRVGDSSPEPAWITLEQALRTMLAFPPNTDSPISFSPADYQRVIGKLQERLVHE